jgi:REP element-mobilizing transposase RayT
LPHLKREGVAYFVTFRLADSLPASEILRLKHERETLQADALAHKRPLTWHEEQQLLAWYSEKVDRLLDLGHAACWLKQPDIGEMVAGALKFFVGQRYDLRAWVIIPNHVHAIVWPHPGYNISQILHSWKSFTATQANRILRRKHAPFWQTESYDHWIRNDDERARLVAYIENNPVKARLCARPEDWRWSSAYDRNTSPRPSVAVPVPAPVAGGISAARPTSPPRTPP